MKRRFLLPVALLLFAAMLLPGLSFAEGFQAVTAQIEQAVNSESNLLPEELPEFQLIDQEAGDASSTVVMAAAVDVPKSATPTKLTLGVKETYKLNISGAKKYVSSNSKVATVSKKGVITGKAAGKATITVTDKKGKKAKIKVTVKNAPKKVSLNKKKLTLEVGDAYKLKATLSSKTASNTLTWKSSNKQVASVDSTGKVTALKAGTAKITIKTFNSMKASCTVTVKKAAEKPTTVPTLEPTPEPTSTGIGYENEQLGISIQFTNLDLTILNGVELQFKCIAINDSDFDIEFKIANVAVNGWEGMWDRSGYVSPHRKTKDTIQITNIDSYTDIGSLDQADRIQLLEFDLIITYGDEKIVIPYKITDLSILNIVR